jgi:hypothetical protein
MKLAAKIVAAAIVGSWFMAEVKKPEIKSILKNV